MQAGVLGIYMPQAAPGANLIPDKEVDLGFTGPLATLLVDMRGISLVVVWLVRSAEHVGLSE